MTTLMDLWGKTHTVVHNLIQTYKNEGLIRVNWHPTEPLALLNYTEKCTFDKAWDDVTLNSRGLIYHTETFEIVARPFPKFFNHSESDAAKFSLNEKVFVTDKADGSLGILYREPTSGLAAIATRGSFASEQARHATLLLRSRYRQWTEVYEQIQQNDVQVTLCFEIVYPENRIVLDYGDTDELVLLGGVSVSDGDILNPYTARVVYAWPGAVTKTLGTMTFRQALELAPRQNAEGVVVRSVNDNRMVKLKQEDYVRLHRIITGLNARAVWDHMRNNDYSTEGLKESLPEEFWDFVDTVAVELIDGEAALWNEIENEYFKRVVVGGDRAQQARAFAGYEHIWALFFYLDEDYARLHEKLWMMLRPDADWTPHAKR